MKTINRTVSFDISQQVRDAVKLCRELSVLQLEIEGQGLRLKVVLGPEPEKRVEVEDVKPVDTTPPEVQASKKRGEDGLTAADQLALYGRVIDAEE